MLSTAAKQRPGCSRDRLLAGFYRHWTKICLALTASLLFWFKFELLGTVGFDQGFSRGTEGRLRPIMVNPGVRPPTVQHYHVEWSLFDPEKMTAGSPEEKPEQAVPLSRATIRLPSFDCRMFKPGDASFNPHLPAAAGLDSLRGLCASPEHASQFKSRLLEPYKYNYERFADKNEGTLDEAFVMSVLGRTEAALATATIASVSRLTNLPILVYASGEEALRACSKLWPPEQFPGVIVFEVPPTSLTVGHFDKLRAVLFAPVVKGVAVEPGTIVTPFAQHLFDFLDRTSSAYPLLPISVDERRESCDGYDGPLACGRPLPGFPDDQRTLPFYGTSHIGFLSSSAHKQWLADEVLKPCYETLSTEGMVEEALREGHGRCESDDVAINSALWRSHAQDQFCLVSLPFYTLDSLISLDWNTLIVAQGGAPGRVPSMFGLAGEDKRAWRAWEDKKRKQEKFEAFKEAQIQQRLSEVDRYEGGFEEQEQGGPTAGGFAALERNSRVPAAWVLIPSGPVVFPEELLEKDSKMPTKLTPSELERQKKEREVKRREVIAARYESLMQGIDTFEWAYDYYNDKPSGTVGDHRYRSNKMPFIYHRGRWYSTVADMKADEKAFAGGASSFDCLI